MKNYLGGGYKLSRILIGVSILVIVGTVVIGRISHAGFKSSISVPLANGKITYKHPDFSLVGLYVENDSGGYTESASVPTGNYEVNTSKTYCTKPSGSDKVNDSRVTIRYVNNSLTFGRVTSKNTKCYVYLDKKVVPPITMNEVLAKYTKDNSRSGEITSVFTGSTPNTVYSKVDDGGTSYFFAGVNPNNWVKLGNLYFRIIRFNGDGSMRLIFSGDGSAQKTGTGTQIGEKAFNQTFDNDAEYVGLKYTLGQVHGTGTNSTILGTSTSTDTTTLYGWYNSKIKPSYASLIDTNAGFCSDRDPYIDDEGITSGGGTGTNSTYFGASIRFNKGRSSLSTYTPTLKCKYASDNLKLPVGLIILDEYMLAGGANLSSKNNTFWLYTGELYWTMTPRESSHLYFIDSDGSLNSFSSGASNGVRPVINLKSSTLFISSGAGTINNPWVVSV